MLSTDILNAFIRHSGNGGRAFVTFGERNFPNGYVRVVGPSANPRNYDDCHVCVARQPDGHVSLTEPLAGVLPSRQRDPAVFAGGPEFGRFRWELAAEYETADALVEALVAAFPKAGLVW